MYVSIYSFIYFLHWMVGQDGKTRRSNETARRKTVKGIACQTYEPWCVSHI